jgi:DNA-binding Lrp family transcriptional regulator
MAALDVLDHRLLELLQQDARRSYRTLAKLAGTTPPTAAARIKRLEDAGVIQGYTIRVDAPQPELDIEIARITSLECHWCHKPTSEPHWVTLEGTRHPFCCSTCRGAYVEKHARLVRQAANG